jgi:hypothetical protein
MLIGAHTQTRFGLCQQALQQLIGRAQMEHGHGPWFAINTARLDDPIVGVASDFDFLKAGHSLCIQGQAEKVKSTLILKRKHIEKLRSLVYTTARSVEGV